MAKFFFYDTNIVKLLQAEEKITGGAAVQSQVWLEGLSVIGHEVSVATYYDRTESIKPDCTHIKLVPIYDRRKGFRWIRWVWYRFPNIYKTLKKVRPDYLYESIPSWESLFTGLFCKRLKIKYIIRISSDSILDDRYLTRNNRLNHYLLKRGLELSDYVLCQNEYQLDLFTRQFPGKKSIKIHNPYIIQNQASTNINKRSYIAWIANFRYLKNLKLLYEIASLLDGEEFQIAGTYLNPHPEVDLYLRKLESLKNVKFRGQIKRQHIPSFLSHAKFLLNTSHYEGFSNTYLEAMSAGTPIITTSNANPDQIINQYNLGIIYEDESDLQQKLQKISSMEYQQLSVQCIEYVKQNHDHIGLSKKLVHFLEKCKE